MRYKIVLANGYVHEGYDEREVDDLIEGITGEYEGLNPSWCWLAGLNVVVRTQVIGVVSVID